MVRTKEQKIKFIKKMNVSKAKLDDKETKLRDGIYKQLYKLIKAYGEEVLPLDSRVMVCAPDIATDNVELISAYIDDFNMVAFRYKELNSWDGGQMDFTDVNTSELSDALDFAIMSLENKWEVEL